MDRAGIVWIVVAVGVVVFVDLLFLELRRAVREAKRIAGRLGGYADLPVFSDLAASEADIARIVTALDALPVLLARAETALAIIRKPFTRRTPPAAVYLPNGSSPG